MMPSMKYFIYLSALFLFLKLNRDYRDLKTRQKRLKEIEAQHQKALQQLDWDYANKKINESDYMLQRKRLLAQHKKELDDMIKSP